MPVTINSNVASTMVQNNLTQSQRGLNTSLERLSTGLRINSAKDDTAGLLITQRMTAQIQGMDQGIRNANDAISIAEVGEGALQTINDSLLRIREIAVQSINDSNTANDREALQLEVNQLLSEIGSIVDRTQFNTLRLFDGNFIAKDFQVGPNTGDKIKVTIPSIDLNEIGNYQIQTINTTSNQGTGSASNPIIATTPSSANTVEAQTVIMGGSFGTTVISVAANETAEQIADRFRNVQQTTGVRATAETTATFDNLSADGTVTFELANSDMGTFLEVSATVTIGDLSGLVSEINNRTGQTGITAEIGGTNGEMILRQGQGKNIVINNMQHSTNGGTINVNGADDNDITLTDGAADSTVIAGVVTLKSDSPFSAYSSEDDAFGSIFDTLAGEQTLSTLENLGSINVSTQAGAEDALDIVDSVLEDVNSVRAELGALQNRFESVIESVSRQSENLRSARSRILDADFAVETTELARNQILVQAGIAVLAQANAIPGSALSLLQ